VSYELGKYGRDWPGHLPSPKLPRLNDEVLLLDRCRRSGVNILELERTQHEQSRVSASLSICDARDNNAYRLRSCSTAAWPRCLISGRAMARWSIYVSPNNLRIVVA